MPRLEPGIFCMPSMSSATELWLFPLFTWKQVLQVVKGTSILKYASDCNLSWGLNWCNFNNSCEAEKVLDARTVLTPDFLLPFHFIIQVICLLEKVIHFASLFISLRSIEHTTLGFMGQEFTDVWHREDYLFHGSIMTDNLQIYFLTCIQSLTYIRRLYKNYCFLGIGKEERDKKNDKCKDALTLWEANRLMLFDRFSDLGYFQFQGMILVEDFGFSKKNEILCSSKFPVCFQRMTERFRYKYF